MHSATLDLEQPDVEAPPPAVRSGEGVKVIRACTINRSAAELFAFWRNLENLPRFMINLVSVTQTTPTRSHWVARGSRNKTIEWDAVIINEHPNEMIAWKTAEESEFRHAGSIRFQPAPGGRGTEVVVSLEYDPLHSDVKILTRLFGKKPKDSVSQDLGRFKALMETGEIPSTAGQPVGSGKQKEEQ